MITLLFLPHHMLAAHTKKDCLLIVFLHTLARCVAFLHILARCVCCVQQLSEPSSVEGYLKQGF